MSETPASQRIRVAVDAPQHSGITGPLDYLSEQALAPGSLVRVPLGRRELMGIVWPGASLEDTDPALLRPILGHFDGLPPLSPAWCELVEFAAGYYQRTRWRTGPVGAAAAVARAGGLAAAAAPEAGGQMGRRAGQASMPARPPCRA